MIGTSPRPIPVYIFLWHWRINILVSLYPCKKNKRSVAEVINHQAEFGRPCLSSNLEIMLILSPPPPHPPTPLPPPKKEEKKFRIHHYITSFPWIRAAVLKCYVQYYIHTAITSVNSTKKEVVKKTRVSSLVFQTLLWPSYSKKVTENDWCQSVKLSQLMALSIMKDLKDISHIVAETLVSQLCRVPPPPFR